MRKFGTHFYFIRHAETTWNHKKLCQGVRDIPLSDKGIKQSEKVSKILATFPIATICTSPLQRAYHTAKMIHHYHPEVPFKVIQELKERDWGKLEGISSQEMYAIERKEEENSTFDAGFDIEKRALFKKRVSVGLTKAFAFHSSPLIVSHGRVFLAVCDLLNLPPLRQLPNLTPVEFKYIDSKWTHSILNMEE